MRNLTRRGWTLIASLVVVTALCVVITFMANNLWLSVATSVGVMLIGAIGISMLYSTGLLTLGHAFFMAVGGYSYVVLASDGSDGYYGLGLDPVLALVLSVIFTGLVGLGFSPLSARLGGLELAVATLGLVFLGQHIAKSAEPLTGGSRGRVVDYFSIGGFELDSGRANWLLVLVLASTAALIAYNISRSKYGLALQAIRDGELFAGAMGIPVMKSKAQVFLISSLFAGLAGALLAITTGAIVPEAYGLSLSLNVLIMVVLGGPAAIVLGSLVGAMVVVGLPVLLREYGSVLPFVATNPLGDGVSPSDAAQYLYGAAVILVLVFAPGGLIEIGKKAGSLLMRLVRKDTRASIEVGTNV